ncbi:uncharacterized protein LOC143276841 [Babylonia areolata]|uniref:uncharacterized protein LOC143276841 n=1 Tax=Babylonia areolata TaxID=304850 RepID=UPI003FCFD14D
MADENRRDGQTPEPKPASTEQQGNVSLHSVSSHNSTSDSKDKAREASPEPPRKPETPRKDEEPKKGEEKEEPSKAADDPKPEPPKAKTDDEAPKRETKKEEKVEKEDVKKEQVKKEEEKKEEPPKTEAKKPEERKPEAKKPEERKPEAKKPEERRPIKPEPKKDPPRRNDGRGKTDETETSKKGGAAAKTDNKPTQEKPELSEVRPRQKVEFFKEELRRLQDNLKRESSKIVAPKQREFKPFIFSTLEPYYNTHTTRFLIEMVGVTQREFKPFIFSTLEPYYNTHTTRFLIEMVGVTQREFKPFIFSTLEPYYNTHTTRVLIEMPEESEQLSRYTCSSRSTAQGLTDPWVDLRMDTQILPHISSRPTTRSDTKSRRSKSRKGTEPSRKEGSTRLPKFPVVAMETKDLVNKQLYYSDVPTLRKELKTMHTAQARNRRDTDYKRTQQDFYRMDLDRLDQVPEGNRQHLTSTYMAYLNTPGSRRAVTECVRTVQGH